MPHFILFFGILINAAEHRALYIIEDRTDKHGILVCVPKGDADTYHVPLPVKYDQARAEWEATLKSPPASHAHTH